jgi:hypothetical protein
MAGIITGSPVKNRFAIADPEFLPGGGFVSSRSRDGAQTLHSVAHTLPAGTILGKATSGAMEGFYVPSILGLTRTAYADNATSVGVYENTANAIIAALGGTTGSLIITGPPSAAGTVSSAVATVSAVTVNGASSTITFSDLNDDFVAGSLIGVNDGSYSPKAVLPSGSGLSVKDGDTYFDADTNLVIGGVCKFSELWNAPTDASLITWVKSALNTAGNFRFVEGL